MGSIRITHRDKVSGILREYEEIILGNRKLFSNWYFMDEAATGKKESTELSLAVFRYCFENILHWSPETIHQNVTEELLIQMHLYPLWKKRIVLPKDLNKSHDFFYIAYLLYPDIFKSDFRNETLEVYQTVLSGELYKIPKNFFDGADGRRRALICLQYLISQKIPYKTIDDLYQKFSETEMKTFLNDNALLIPCTRFFESPIDYLHFSLPKQMRNDKDYAYTKRQYYRNRVKIEPEDKSVKQYLAYIKGGKKAECPFLDSLRNVDYKAYGACMYYFIRTILPTEVLITSYDLSIPEELYDYLTTDEAEELMKKYKIFDAAKAVSPNLVKAVDCILPSSERSLLTLPYAVEKYERLHLSAQKERTKITPVVRKWLDHVEGIATASPYYNEDGEFLSVSFNECLWYFMREIVPQKRAEEFEDVSELYDYFLSEEAERLMKEYRLWDGVKLLSANPIRVVHGAITKHGKEIDDAESYRYALRKYAKAHAFAL